MEYDNEEYKNAYYICLKEYLLEIFLFININIKIPIYLNE